MKKVLVTTRIKYNDGTLVVRQKLMESQEDVVNLEGILSPFSEFKDRRRDHGHFVSVRSIAPNMMVRYSLYKEGELRSYKVETTTIITDSKPKLSKFDNRKPILFT